MEASETQELFTHLSKCKHLMNRTPHNLQQLNEFCLEFLRLSEGLQRFLLKNNNGQRYDQIDIIYLCLTQIVTCIRNMERAIKTEASHGIPIQAGKEHFIDRIHWCLDRLRSCIAILKSASEADESGVHEENTFVDLMDMVLDQLAPYTSYKDENASGSEKNLMVDEENQNQAKIASQQIRSNIDMILSHTLAFANVALKQDKKALSALCQKVIRECMAFQEECTMATPVNDSNRKIKGISLENALYQLEDYINEALLRLVFTCFLDYDKLSVERLRKEIKEKRIDDTQLDELIADFDVNIDRTTQIGMFAIAFAANSKIKTVVRSCLASFESLDSCIIPSLQSKVNSNMYAHILEQHFNDEVRNFKQAIQEIIDSYAFTSCYYDLLNQAIKSCDKQYSKQALEDIAQMGKFLYEHFQIIVNQKELQKYGDRLELYKKFTVMLHECQAILKYSDREQIDVQRILKRFKILRSILRKFMDELGGKSSLDGGNPLSATKSQVFLMSDELSESQQMFASIGISPSICSILYSNTPVEKKRAQKLASDSMKGNYSKIPVTPLKEKAVLNNSSPKPSIKYPPNAAVATAQVNRFNVRRKESLRKAMFKKHTTTTCDNDEIYGIYNKNNSGSLQISEILDDLNDFRSHSAENMLDTSII
ncbi:serendipity locus protein alpha [Musca vetustissima]|uniref:serendipity locus protein alpha n=1 Tax=Musca vetustissima TaxID=27455 RepID=UPI002AB64860|nr:serendipity locus protein alpha [Musca vetustissima]